MNGKGTIPILPSRARFPFEPKAKKGIPGPSSWTSAFPSTEGPWNHPSYAPDGIAKGIVTKLGGTPSAPTS
jgi:hypothetical protein